jgi:hypothetical protein
MAEKFNLRDEEERRVWDSVFMSNMAGLVAHATDLGVQEELASEGTTSAAQHTMNSLAVYSDVAGKLADRAVMLRRLRTDLVERPAPSDIAIITR